MEKTLRERLQRLKEVLQAIQMETIPLPGHSDPGALKDCWLTAFEMLEGVESASKANVFKTWYAAVHDVRVKVGIKYTEVCRMLDIHELKYIPEDNTHSAWDSWSKEVDGAIAKKMHNHDR